MDLLTFNHGEIILNAFILSLILLTNKKRKAIFILFTSGTGKDES